MPRLRDGSAVEDPRLGRLVEFDERSRNFPVCALLGDDEQTPCTKTWTITAGWPVLDQGAEGACVGYAVTNDLRFAPAPIRKLDGTFAREKIYWPAQRIDPWDGGAYPGATPFYEGTSVLAGMKVATALGFYGQFRWAFGEAELALAVSYQGPAVLGLNWHADMFKPDAKGFIRPTGRVVGGHAILCVGIAATHGYYTLYNSWGPDWGRTGRCRITRADMATLLAADGEAAIPTSRSTL